MGKDKLKRFSELNKFENVIQPEIKYDDSHHIIKGKWNEEFNLKNPIVLELGCGGGEYTIGLARLFKEKSFIGIDIKGARIWKGAKIAKEDNIYNVRFLRTKVEFIEKFFDKNEVEEIWLTFSDPQKKKPRKRLTSPNFMDRYKKILNENGTIHLKTDSRILYQYTLDLIQKNNYKLIHDIPDVYKDINKLKNNLKNILAIKTFYEKKWLKDNKSIKYLSFKINS